MDTLKTTWSFIVEAFHGHTLGCLEMQAIVIGWCLLVIGLIDHTVYGHLTKAIKISKMKNKKKSVTTYNNRRFGA